MAIMKSEKIETPKTLEQRAAEVADDASSDTFAACRRENDERLERALDEADRQREEFYRPRD